MTTLRKLATKYAMQPYELAAFLNLGPHYNETAEISDTDLTWIREALTQSQEIIDRDDDLLVAAQNVTRAETAHTQALTTRNEEIINAAQRGTKVAEIAERTGLTRAMIYAVLNGQRRRT